MKLKQMLVIGMVMLFVLGTGVALAQKAEPPDGPVNSAAAWFSSMGDGAGQPQTGGPVVDGGAGPVVDMGATGDGAESGAPAHIFPAPADPQPDDNPPQR